MTYLYLAIAIVGEVTATSVLKSTHQFSRPRADGDRGGRLRDRLLRDVAGIKDHASGRGLRDLVRPGDRAGGRRRRRDLPRSARPPGHARHVSDHRWGL